MSGIHEHLEHAEHAGHHGADPFDKRVAVTMAIVAACLAGISMLGHRKHNEVLQLQGNANRLQTEAGIIQTKANIDHTHATDQWGFYQAKNIRQHMYTANLGLIEAATKDPAKAKETEALRKNMQKQVDKYVVELPEMQVQAKALTKSGDEKQAEALKKQEESKGQDDLSHDAHHQADRLDYAHLGAEIGLVLCSIALLTKKRAYWLIGAASGLLALGTASSAYVIPHRDHTEAHADEHGPKDGHKPDAGGH